MVILPVDSFCSIPSGESQKWTFTAAWSASRSVPWSPNLKAQTLVRGKSQRTSARSIFSSSATWAKSWGEKPVLKPAPRKFGLSRYQTVESSAKSRSCIMASGVKRLSMTRTPPAERKPPALLVTFWELLCSNRVSRDDAGFRACTKRGQGWMYNLRLW